jgi:chorismate mutase / prephenate dehydrogenase
VEENLESLRDRIRDLDRKLISLAAERVNLARRIGEIKRARNTSTVDYAQERVVLERARDAAAKGGLDRSVAEDILARLIRASVTVQEEDSLRFSRTGEGKRAVIVGGAGRMGRWMAHFLGAQGYVSGALDPAAESAEDDWARRNLASADLVVCAAPPLATVSIYREWAKAPPRGTIVDIASIKAPLIEPIRRLQEAGARAASIHPMFGPSIALLRDADVVVCETGDEEATRAVEDLFHPTTARLVRIPLEDHDRIMADLLSMAHATAIAFALALPEQEHPVRSTTFQALEHLAGVVARESPDVYYEIQAGNPHSLAAVEKLRAAVDRVIDTVRGGSREAFADLLEQGRRRTSVGR